MKLAALSLLSALALVGCRSDDPVVPPAPRPGDPPIVPSTPPPIAQQYSPIRVPPTDDEPVARVGAVTLRRADLVAPLVEAHGLGMMLRVLQRDLARDEATQNSLALAQGDFDRERQLTVRQAFGDIDDSMVTRPGEPPPDEATLAARRAERYDGMLAQLLTTQKLTRAEFDLTMQTNAYLRALARPSVGGKLTDEDVKRAFGAIYGERVRVRHIALPNPQEIAEAQRRLAAGEAFADVARALSKATGSAPDGGLVPPFARSTPNIDSAFLDVAFALQPGEVSQPVQSNEMYHLIKLEERLPPRSARFEDHRESVREQLEEGLAQQEMQRLRQEMGAQVLRGLVILDPQLKRLYDARVAESEPRADERAEVIADLDRAREAVNATQPASEPSTQPATTTQP